MTASTPMTGARLIAETLVRLGVETVFCYPGGANLEILDALSVAPVTLIRTEHEQGAVFAAQGYARATGRLGVCLATSGPGATNLVTGIADANSDSIPILAITGNVPTRWLGRNAFQEVNIVDIVRPITKLARQAQTVAEIPRVLAEAARLAVSGRPGPVLIDIPKDIQQARGIAAPVPVTVVASGPEQAALSEAVRAQLHALFTSAKRPVIYAGGGVVASGSSALLRLLAERLRCPVAVTLMGLGVFDSHHPLFLGPLGMHGAWAANVAVNEADLVLALGVRFDDRVIGDPDSFAHGANIVHVDIDPAELGKNRSVTLGIPGDLREILPALLELAYPLPAADWLAHLAAAANAHPLRAETAPGGALGGAEAITHLAGMLPENAIVSTGVGQHQMWAMQHCRPRQPRHFLSSAGFGTMGFGLPAAIGAKLACPGSTVVDIDGDGSLNMTINELATCRRYGIGVKVMVVNNQMLGMVRQWQDLIYGGNRVVSTLGEGGGEGAAPYPDFLSIAAGYGVKAERVSAREALGPAIARMLHDPDEPYLLDVLVRREDDVFPMIPSGHGYRDVIFSAAGPPLTDT